MSDVKDEEVINRLDQILRMTVDMQIENSDPPETEQAFKRLEALGFKEHEVYDLIGRVLVNYLQMITEEGAFDKDSFIKDLETLPEPFVKLPIH